MQKNGRVVALKVFPCSPTDAADVVTRLRKEAAAVQWLKDPRICQLEAIEETDDLICVAMELLQYSFAERSLPVDSDKLTR